MVKTLLCFFIFYSTSVVAADLTSEIQKINQKYGNTMPYPIVVLDKPAFKKFIGKNDFFAKDEALIIKGLQSFISQNHKLAIGEEEATSLAALLIHSGKSALAHPVIDRDSRPYKMKSCFVLPAVTQASHEAEVKRVLGADILPQLYKNLDIKQVMRLLSLEELQLFSLYHELSHCLDQTYTIKNFESDPEGHGIHQSEAFAEVSALFLLSQEKDMSRLGAGRSILRTLYSKYYGPYLAQSPPSMAGPAYNQGGTIYFLVTPILEAQVFIDRGALRTLSLPQVLELSRRVVETHSLKSRTFQAMHRTFADGAPTLLEYKKLAKDNPDLFLQTYQELLFIQQVLSTAEDLLPE
jgi:hypothetical protein